MSAHTSLLHELYNARDLPRLRSFLSGTAYQPGGSGGGNASASGGKGKQAASSNNHHRDASAQSGGLSYGSLSKSPRFSGFMHGNGQDPIATKEEVNARDKQGRTVLHLAAAATDAVGAFACF